MVTVAALTGLALAAGCKKEQGENEAADSAKTAVAAPAPQPGVQSYALEAPDSLRALAKLPLDSAVKLALARVPNGAIEKVELEREKGAIIWSFDIRVPGQEGISEVNVNAVTGAVWPTEHENAATEAREAREDSAAARRPAVPPAKRP
jgi:uncharacterized membrane protein YkoI